MAETEAVYTRENWPEMIQAMHSGEVIEIDEAIFDYFLGVLPPVFMHKHMNIGGRLRMVAFGFAEGYEPITAFWQEAGRFYAQRTGEWNRG